MVPLAKSIGYLAFGLPAAFVIAATLNSFLPIGHEQSSTVGAH